MANTAQLLRRQSSRDIVLKSQKSIDQMELRELRGRLVPKDHHGHSSSSTAHQLHHTPMYGAMNQGFIGDAFDESIEQESDDDAAASTSKAKANFTAAVRASIEKAAEEIVKEQEGDERESWDSKIMFLLATIG